MKTQVWVYVVVAVLSLGAGVAIAGVPTFEDREPTIQPPPETTTTSTDAPTTTETPVDESDDVTSESLMSNEDDEPDADEADETDDADETDAAEEPAVTDAAPETTTTTTPLVQREALDVVVVNAAEQAGVASQGSELLEQVGYFDVGAFDGSEIFDATVVFAAVGTEREAQRLAQELGISTDLIFPIDTAPPVDGLGDEVQLMVYVGRDARVLPFFN